jgi:hypothetical protein
MSLWKKCIDIMGRFNWRWSARTKTSPFFLSKDNKTLELLASRSTLIGVPKMMLALLIS